MKVSEAVQTLRQVNDELITIRALALNITPDTAWQAKTIDLLIRVMEPQMRASVEALTRLVDAV